jgi:hypothetical protein
MLAYGIRRYPPTNSPGNIYERTMSLIRQFNNTGWKHILKVPDDLFKDFWAIAEMHPEIIFDEERQWQYFKVSRFGKRYLSV